MHPPGFEPLCVACMMELSKKSPWRDWCFICPHCWKNLDPVQKVDFLRVSFVIHENQCQTNQYRLDNEMPPMTDDARTRKAFENIGRGLLSQAKQGEANAAKFAQMLSKMSDLLTACIEEKDDQHRFYETATTWMAEVKKRLSSGDMGDDWWKNGNSPPEEE